MEPGFRVVQDNGLGFRVMGPRIQEFRGLE